MAPNCPMPEAKVGSRMTAARVTRGAISLSSSNHFPLMPYSIEVKPVALPPGRPRLATKPPPTGSVTFTNTIGTVRDTCCNGQGHSASGQDDIRRQRDQFRREFANVIGIACAPTVVDLHIPADGPAQLLQSLMESREARLTFRIIGGEIHEHADAPYPLGLLRARRERPRDGCAGEQRDELATFHSITSSAMASSLSGIWRLSALAALRLITSSNLVDRSTGMSAGFSPLRIRAA